MNTFLTLIRREWLQHRFGWAMLSLLPLAVALPVMGFGTVQFDDETVASAAGVMPIFLAVLAMLATTAATLVILWGASIVKVSGLARRDHADRSIEFWLSMPVGHGSSLAVPLLVHLLLVPLAALGLGLLGGLLSSLVIVSRMEGLAEWVGLPWGVLAGALLAGAARLAVGILLATLWLLPMLMLGVLAGAWFKGWALPALAAIFGIGGLILEYQFGSSLLYDWAGSMFEMAGRSLLNAGATHLVAEGPLDLLRGLQAAPAWAAADVVSAVGLMLSPGFAMGLLIAALCFATLVRWRGRA